MPKRVRLQALRADNTVAGTQNTSVDYRFATVKSFGVIGWHKTRQAAEKKAQTVDAYTAKLKREGKTCDASLTWYADEPVEVCRVWKASIFDFDD